MVVETTTTTVISHPRKPTNLTSNKDVFFFILFCFDKLLWHLWSRIVFKQTHADFTIIWVRRPNTVNVRTMFSFNRGHIGSRLAPALRIYQ